jgi:replication factor A1
VSDGGDKLRVVLWGEKALVPVSPGDRIEIFHAVAKPGRFGGIELGVGRGSAFRVPPKASRPILFCGTIIAGPGCTFIDNGHERYIIDGTFPHGSEMKVSGIMTGGRIIPEKAEPVELHADDVTAHLDRFLQELK